MGSGQVGIGDPATTTDGCSNFCKRNPAQVLTGPAAPLTGAVDLNVAYLAACVTRADHSLWCWGAGAGDFATPLMVGGNAVVNVAEHTSCGSAAIDSALRYLTRDNQLRTPINPVSPVCQ